MNNSQVTDHQHGLTLAQWGLLLVAFVIGLGSTFALREIMPPVHANVVQTVSENSGANR